MYVLGGTSSLKEYRREGATDATGNANVAGLLLGLDPAILPTGGR